MGKGTKPGEAGWRELFIVGMILLGLLILSGALLLGLLYMGNKQLNEMEKRYDEVLTEKQKEYNRDFVRGETAEYKVVGKETVYEEVEGNDFIGFNFATWKLKVWDKKTDAIYMIDVPKRVYTRVAEGENIVAEVAKNKNTARLVDYGEDVYEQKPVRDE